MILAWATMIDLFALLAILTLLIKLKKRKVEEKREKYAEMNGKQVKTRRKKWRMNCSALFIELKGKIYFENKNM